TPAKTGLPDGRDCTEPVAAAGEEPRERRRARTRPRSRHAAECRCRQRPESIPRRAGYRSVRERIRTELEPDDLTRRAGTGLHVERRARADRRPQAASLPAALRIVDAAVEPLRVVPGRIGDAEHHPLA